MAMIDWDLHYDRRATAGFLAHFLYGGVAESLAEYARYAPYPVDLQFRCRRPAGSHHPRHARSADPAGARLLQPRGAPRRGRGGARRGNSTRLTGSFPRSPQICTQDYRRLTWLRRNQPGGLRSQHDRPASTTCPLITVSSRTPRCRPTTVGLEGRCRDRPDVGCRSPVSRRACAPDLACLLATRRPAAVGHLLVSRSSSYPAARPGLTHRDEQNVL